MTELAVIIPYCGEFPHLHYTLQSIQMELEGWGIDFEVIGVDNGAKVMIHGPCASTLPWKPEWWRRIECMGTLSHWSAKNLAVQSTDAPFLFFIDAHAMVHPGTLRDMFRYYQISHERINGSLHLPISDFLRTDKPKAYRFLYQPQWGLLHYENEFLNSPADTGWPVETPRPCLSTCGMLCRREHITDVLRYWPEELGPYGGGENYFNFTMGIMGYSVNLFPAQPLRHWHIPGVWSRDYMPTYPQWARNIAIATYLVAGEKWVSRLLTESNSLPEGHPVRFVKPAERAEMLREIITDDKLRERLIDIKTRAKFTIEEWAEKWTITHG
ncbi:MAG: glycosyltransferase family A protein [Patescibacteria group bacterium]